VIEPIANPFVGARVATRYARARPALHDRAIARVRRTVPAPSRVLDLACGTGLSTRPLLGWASFVVAVDVSLDMLGVFDAPPAARVNALAERLPLAGASVDLVTISSAIHWLGPEALAEVRRVLVDGGHLAVYDVWFPGKAEGIPAFSTWVHEVCGPRYPQLRDPAPTLDRLGGEGFELVERSEVHETVAMSAAKLTDLLMTHSNRVAAIRDGVETEEEQRRFLSDGIADIWGDADERGIVFGITLELHRKTAT
jgi:ubiquinone/menaquinone biosynthesis C-methylase UbiE